MMVVSALFFTFVVSLPLLCILPFSPLLLMLLMISRLFSSVCMLTHSLQVGSLAVCFCFPKSHGTSPSVCYCRLCWTWTGLYYGLKAFASNENLVLDYRASARLTLLFPTGREWARRRGGCILALKQLEEKNSTHLLGLRLCLSQANDVTEACSESVFSGQRKAEKLGGRYCVWVEHYG